MVIFSTILVFALHFMKYSRFSAKVIVYVHKSLEPHEGKFTAENMHLDHYYPVALYIVTDLHCTSKGSYNKNLFFFKHIRLQQP